MTIIPNNFQDITKEEATFMVQDSVTELLRFHAKSLLVQALEAEVTETLNSLKESSQTAIRNGYLPKRLITINWRYSSRSS